MDLEYNDDELASLGGESDSDPNEATRWPAVRALGVAASAGAAQFLMEEVIAGWSTDRRTALTPLGPLEQHQRSFAAAVGSGATAAELLGDIPLVQRAADGSYQLHDLWRDALVAHHRSSDVSNTLERLGRLLLAEQRFVDAAEIFQVAESERGVADAAEQLVSMPFILIASNDLERMLDIVNAVIPDSAIPGTGCKRDPAGTIGDERLAVEGFRACGPGGGRTGRRRRRDPRTAAGDQPVGDHRCGGDPRMDWERAAELTARYASAHCTRRSWPGISSLALSAMSIWPR